MPCRKLTDTLKNSYENETVPFSFSPCVNEALRHQI